VAGRATPTGAAGHAGATANLKLRRWDPAGQSRGAKADAGRDEKGARSLSNGGQQ
jgi:hypothetical protein